MDTALSLKIENAVHGFRNAGYLVTARPVEGQEVGFYTDLKAGLDRLDETRRQLRIRVLNDRNKAHLWAVLPEPCWGVEAPKACSGQSAWETAMGMRGYAGSAAEREDRVEKAH